MKSAEIKHNVQNLIDNFSEEEFVFELLIAFGISKTAITRLKKGDYNLSKVDGEILFKKKIFFKIEASDKLLSSIEEVSKEARILKQQPRFAILTDYKQLVAKDLKLGKNLDIAITELPNYFDFFLPLAGSEVYNSENNNEADRDASYKMASLYDLLIEENPNIYNSKESVHNLNIFLSRLLFCFFAEDTEIFAEDSIFTNTLVQQTIDDGSDTHLFLNELFERLNTQNASHFPAFLQKFEYVNGGLFSQKIESPRFNFKARKTLVELGDLNWKNINPDIFGSMIQAVVIPEYRSDLGMHYTSVENILKLIKPLFLDELYEAYENATTLNQLRTLINRISKIKFFDPACGSGNFLIITYKEIRLLEILILEKITDLEGSTPTLKWTSVQLSQFYGIEIDDFAHEMAILSLWLAEHQMNKVFEDRLMDFGKSKPILPLKEAGQITQGNATRVDWNSVCPITTTDEVYIIGNPPYLGGKGQSSQQKEDMAIVFNKTKNYKELDYIACWFMLSAKYIKGNELARYSFVSTSSINQGAQVEQLWPLINFEKCEIFFAYSPFNWNNNAKGKAGVTVSIIGVRNFSSLPKYLFNNQIKTEVKRINGYLTPNSETYVTKRNKAFSNLPTMITGNSPYEGGNLMLTPEEKNDLLKNYPESEVLIRRTYGANEYINGIERYCLWIDDSQLSITLTIPPIKERIDRIREIRKKGGDVARGLANKPHQFRYTHSGKTSIIIIPIVSSGRRKYIPIGFLDKDSIVLSSAAAIYETETFVFAVISSRMHMLWVELTSGKLRGDYRYLSALTYNTFPFPDLTTKQKENLNLYVFSILDERAKHPEKTMAQLYNPSTMPKGLLQAHQELDLAIEQCYRLQPFKNDTERLEYLFKLYEEMTLKDTLFAKVKKTRKK